MTTHNDETTCTAATIVGENTPQFYDPHDLWEAVTHCASPISAVSDLNTPDDSETLNAKYLYAEHCMVGDELKLTWNETTMIRAGDKPIQLENGLQLTYGKINGLGGDFFGTYEPICLGPSFEQQCERFLKAYGCLAKNPKTGAELEMILESRKQELTAVATAREHGTSVFEAYKTLYDGMMYPDEMQMQALTWKRATFGEFAAPGVLRLAQLNLDHFGSDAHTAYNAGHFCAMREAANGDLHKAYGMNAFADHYLGDCFAAGHIRTPRRFLHGGLTPPAKDMCSKYMHDEDNALGLTVRNRRGETWKAYGDKMMFERINDDNRSRLTKCLQASADEVFVCYMTRKMIVKQPEDYAAWKFAPVLDAALGGNNHSPLFTAEGDIRVDLNNKDCWQHKPLGLWNTWAGVYTDLEQSPTFKQY